MLDDRCTLEYAFSDLDMYTVLMVACSSKNESEERILQCVNKLIEKGAKVNDYDR